MTSEAGAELRARLAAAGAVLGLPIEVHEGDDWSIADGVLHVGLGWYSVRGHSAEEAVALALLHLWEGPRAARLAPARARRRDSVVAQRPELTPLLDAVIRLQSARELLQAMPGLRVPLAAALTRSLPADPDTLPRHVQWVTQLLARGMGFRFGGAPSDALVAAELAQLATAGGAGRDALNLVLAPDSTRPALQRYERALVLLLPPYERLLTADLAAAGLDSGSEAGVVDKPEPGVEGLAGAPGAEDEAAPGADAELSEGAADAAADEQERARAGEGQERAEGADLFAAEQAGFVERMLETPLPGAGAFWEAALAAEAEAGRDDDAAPREPGEYAGGGGYAGATALHEYRARVADLGAAIERMREVWARVIAERIALRPTLSRRPRPEGEELAGEALPTALAQARAGIPRPDAYRSRVQMPRRARRAGSTDYVFLIDRSASMQGRIAAAASDAMIVLLESLAAVERDIEFAERATGTGLELDVRTALVVFDAEAHTVKPLSRGLSDAVRRELDAAIRSPQGSTNDGAALAAAGAELGLAGGRPVSDADGIARTRLVFLISDGGSNDPLAAARQLRILQQAGVRVIGCGLGTDDLRARYAPDGIRVDDPTQLAGALHDIIAADVTQQLTHPGR